jgi:hypothetical protein
MREDESLSLRYDRYEGKGSTAHVVVITKLSFGLGLRSLARPRLKLVALHFSVPTETPECRRAAMTKSLEKVRAFPAQQRAASSSLRDRQGGRI